MKRTMRLEGRQQIYRLKLADLVNEAVSGMVQRPARTVFTMLGTVIGIGAFIAILGLAQTANGQISKQFNLLDATQVTVNDTGTSSGTTDGYNFPPDADQRIGRLNGVTAAGVWWQVPFNGADVATMPNQGSTSTLNVYAASPGLLRAAGVRIGAGVPFNSYHNNTRQRVALISTTAASEIGLSTVANEPAIFIDGQPFTVIGTIASSARLPQISLGIVIPATTAQALWGDPQPGDAAQMLISTQLGAAQLIASQAAVALRPDNPSLLSAAAALNPTSLRHAVSGSLNSLLLALAGLAIIIGALGIANTTLVAIMERAPEIGIRRALGARSIHIIEQFLAESAVIGLIGGAIGSSIAVVVILAVTITQHWTAVLQPQALLLAPVAGAVIGLLAGLYPAIQAGRIEPTAVLRG